MAYLDDELEKQKMGGGGSVLAGSGGAAATTGAPTNTGSGFTNLQKYLGANKGSGGGLATAMTEQGQEGVDAINKSANEAADKWADGEINTVNRSADDVAGTYATAQSNLSADPWAKPVAAPTYDNKAAADREGYNALDANYQKAKDHATNFSGDYNMQNAGLQKKFGYGSGFAGLDTFLGRQDGKETIQNWQAGVTPGNASAQAGKVNTAIAAGQGRIDSAKTGFQQGQVAAQKAANDARNASLPTNKPTNGAPATPVGGIAGNWGNNQTAGELAGNAARHDQAANDQLDRQEEEERRQREGGW